MIRAGLLAVLLAGPVGAEELCPTAWEKVSLALGSVGEVGGRISQDGDWCLVTDAVLRQGQQYQPDVHIDALRFRGSAVGWLTDGSGAPEDLEIAVKGLRLVVQTGDPRMDWLFAAQSRPNRIDAGLALSWDPGARELRLETLTVDFPGENLIEASGKVAGVDLSSTAGLQMSATGFAITGADVHLQLHGLFEWYVLMTLGPSVLPSEGDIGAAFAGLQKDLVSFVGELPGASFSDDSKAALVAVIGALPNPAGDLTVSLRAEPGFGPVRLGGLAVHGVEELLLNLAPMFQGVTVDVGWTPDDDR